MRSINDSLGIDAAADNLDFSGVFSNISGISKAIDAVNLDSIAAGVDHIASRFTAMGAVAFAVIQRMTNAAIDFAKLPFKDAIVYKQGTGERKMAVFADPNCGYCKRFERDLNEVKNVTVYTFLYPILGPDSIEKSKNIWCAKDRSATWREWMLEGAPPTKAMGQCDVTALQRNAEFGRKYRINGTPGIVFEDGKRVPGAMNAEQIEKQLVASRSARP